MRFFDKLVDMCEKYDISKHTVCIVGSSVISDIIERESGDIDAILLPSERERLLSKYGSNLHVSKSGIIDFGDVQFCRNRYLVIGLSDGEIFNSKYMNIYDEFHIVKAELEIAKKIKRNEPKDRLDVIKYCNSVSSRTTDWELVYRLVSYKKPVSNSLLHKFVRSISHHIVSWGE